MPQGEYLLQTAAGSTIGRILITLAKLRGVKTINVVRRKEQVQELLDIGCAALATFVAPLHSTIALKLFDNIGVVEQVFPKGFTIIDGAFDKGRNLLSP